MNSRPLCELLLVSLCVSFSACSSTSDPHMNPRAGLNHPLVNGAQPWPTGQMTQPDQPGGIWFPAKGSVQGTIVCLHGIQTHGGWFAPLAGPLSAGGWNVVAPDRRGSGLNTAAPFTKGHTQSDDELLQDLSAQMSAAQKLAPSKPVILLGTSWGANLAGAYCAKGVTPRPAALAQLVPATKTRYGLLAEIKTLLSRKLPFSDVHYLPGAIQPEGGHPKTPPKTGEPPSDSRSAKSGPIWQWIGTDRESGTLVTKPSRGTILAGRSLNKTWTKAPQGSLPRMLVIVATRDQIMNNAAAITTANLATALGQAVIVSIEAGHGAQLSHPDEIAKIVLTWVQSWR